MGLSSLACFCCIIFSATFSSALLLPKKTNKCPFEPSTRCDTFRQAKACDAVEYCAEHVWLQQLLPIGGGGYCDAFTGAAQYLRGELRSWTTEGNEKLELRNVCNILASDSDVRQQCHELVNQTVSVILGLATSIVEHTTVQSLFCNISQREIHHLRPLYSSPPENNTEKLISLFPLIQKANSKTSHLYTNEITDTNNYHDCDLCKSTLQSLSDLLQDKNTEDVVHRSVKIFCSLLPSSVQDRCNSFVFEYSHLVVTLMGQAINPERLCQLMNACFDPNE